MCLATWVLVHSRYRQVHNQEQPSYQVILFKLWILHLSLSEATLHYSWFIPNHHHRWTANSPGGRGRHVGSALRWHHPLVTRTGPALGEGQQKATGRLDRVLGLFHAKDGLPRAPVQPCHKNSWIQRKEYLEWKKIFFQMFFFLFFLTWVKEAKKAQ